MSGGDNISNIQCMYSRERKYLDTLKGIENELKDILDQPLLDVASNIKGLINYLEGIINE